ncbi:MAG: hypothetical protein RL338_1044 [Chloroflexota bacterium]|jgi:hypothetical protein
MTRLPTVLAAALLAGTLALPALAAGPGSGSGATRIVTTQPPGAARCFMIVNTPNGRWNLVATIQVKDVTTRSTVRFLVRYDATTLSDATTMTSSDGVATIHLNRLVPRTTAHTLTAEVWRATTRLCLMSRVLPALPPR